MYLSVTLISGLICFAEIKSHYLGVVIAELLHDVQGPLTKCLTNGIKEHEDQICQVPCFGKKKNYIKKICSYNKTYMCKKKNLKDKCAFLKFNVWVSFSYEFLKCSLMQLTWVQLLYSLPFMKKNVDFRYQRIFRTKHTPSMFFRWSNHFINECLSWSKKHDKDAKNDFFTKPENSSVDIKWILHVSIH